MSKPVRTLVVIETKSGNTFALEKLADGNLKLLHNADHIEGAEELASFETSMLKMIDVREMAVQCNECGQFAQELYNASQACARRADGQTLSEVAIPVAVTDLDCVVSNETVGEGHQSLQPLQGRVVSVESVGEGLECVPESRAMSSEEAEEVAKKEFQFVERWPIPAHYKLGTILGIGAYGRVRQAWDENCDRRVAVKEVKFWGEDDQDKMRILREMKLLRCLQHSHIVQIFNVCLSELRCYVYMIMECCDTDLEKVLKDERGLSMPVTRRLAYNLCVGCAYLHENGIYHRDLKPANCLANKDCSVKIGDFNLAKAVRQQGIQRTLTVDVGTRWYQAPEVVLQLRYTAALDVWSFGCILAELFRALNTNGRRPRSTPLFPVGEDEDQLGKIIEVLYRRPTGTPATEPQFAALPFNAQRQINAYVPYGEGFGVRNEVPPESSPEGRDLLCKVLKFYPELRITMADTLLHPFFNKVKRSSSQETEACTLDLNFEEPQLEDDISFNREFRNEANQFSTQKCAP